MGDTFVFLLCTFVSTILVSGLLLWNRSVERSAAAARVFFCFCVILSVAALLAVILISVTSLGSNPIFLLVFRFLIYRGWMVIGTAISAAVLMLVSQNRQGNEYVTPVIRSFVFSPLALKGICFSVAVSFLGTEIGKLTHDADMREFFLQSGYPVWFLYFVIAAEVLGAIGLLIPRTRVPAAAGLSILMLGAITTHSHNHDPFSDSLEALHLLILLLCILVLRLFGRRGDSPPMEAISSLETQGELRKG